MCGVKTNIVTAVEIRDKDASDTKLLPDLVDATAKNFHLNEVSADKGYGSVKNYQAIQRHGATRGSVQTGLPQHRVPDHGVAHARDRHGFLGRNVTCTQQAPLN